MACLEPTNYACKLVVANSVEFPDAAEAGFEHRSSLSDFLDIRN